jgi:hypothetical protein
MLQKLCAVLLCAIVSVSMAQARPRKNAAADLVVKARALIDALDQEKARAAARQRAAQVVASFGGALRREELSMLAYERTSSLVVGIERCQVDEFLRTESRAGVGPAGHAAGHANDVIGRSVLRRLEVADRDDLHRRNACGAQIERHAEIAADVPVSGNQNGAAIPCGSVEHRERKRCIARSLAERHRRPLA